MIINNILMQRRILVLCERIDGSSKEQKKNTHQAPTPFIYPYWWYVATYVSQFIRRTPRRSSVFLLQSIFNDQWCHFSEDNDWTVQYRCDLHSSLSWRMRCVDAVRSKWRIKQKIDERWSIKKVQRSSTTMDPTKNLRICVYLYIILHWGAVVGCDFFRSSRLGVHKSVPVI